MSITRLHKNIYTRIFIAVLFIIFQTGKQPKCLSIGKWVNKLTHSYTMGYCLAIKKMKLIHMTAQIDLKDIILIKEPRHKAYIVCDAIYSMKLKSW